jgi:CRISPR-associated RAMP protein (TIGR02581 family)
MYRDGRMMPVIPGSSLKGVFRSCAEQLLPGSCDIFRAPCAPKIRQEERNASQRQQGAEFSAGKERYKLSCPTCKLFGSTILKSRVYFSDAYPVGDYRIGSRASAAIDRITGATREGALYEFEYIEDAVFKCSISLKNFFKWHIKLIFEIFDRIEQGLLFFGGLTSKGFGQMKVQNVNIAVRYYGKKQDVPGYADNGFYKEKRIEGFKTALALLEDVSINDNNTLQGCDLEYDEKL